MNQELIDFCKYLQPIVSGCSGFIRTEGFMTHFPGVLILMNMEETYCSIIKLPVIHNVYLTSSINKFLGLKTEEEQSNVIANTYFIGYNIKQMHSFGYYMTYKDIDLVPCIYSEDNCTNIPGFEQASGSSDVGEINVSDGINSYRVPASKIITPINKGDTASLKIYKYIANPSDNNLRTVRYTTIKKKFKLQIDNFSNILVL